MDPVFEAHEMEVFTERSSHNAPSLCLHIHQTPDTKHQTPAKCEAKKSPFAWFYCKKKPAIVQGPLFVYFSFFSVSSSWFSMVLMSASSKAPIKAFPCDGLFALKNCRSNPESGREINPMALSAHYKAFCTVMISQSMSASLAYITHQPFSHDNN